MATTCYLLLRAITSAAWAKLRSRRCRRSCATSTAVQLARRLKRPAGAAAAEPSDRAPELTPEQRPALAAFEAGGGPFLLFGATGSGKTEVYLHAVQSLLARDPQAQALVMVPEINLTPQLQARFVERFGAGNVGRDAQRHDPPAALEKLAVRAHRRGAHRAGHAHGGIRFACRT